MTVVESLREELEEIRKRKGTETLALIKKVVNSGVTVCLTVRSRPENECANETMRALLPEKHTLVKIISVAEESPSDCLRINFRDITN